MEAANNPSYDAVAEISSELRQLLAHVSAPYLKTKNFRWQMSGRHFRDYHLLLDDKSTQLFAMSDDIAERARKLGGTTLRSVSDISRYQRVKANNVEFFAPQEMLTELLQNLPALKAATPPPFEPPNLVTQLVIMVLFILIATLALKRFPPKLSRKTYVAGVS